VATHEKRRLGADRHVRQNADHETCAHRAPLMAETIGVTPNDRFRGAAISAADLATDCRSVNSSDPTNQSRCKTEYLDVAYLNLRIEKLNPNRERDRHCDLQRSCDVNKNIELLNNFIVECGAAATTAARYRKVAGNSGS
jgi:hypothetical protein